MLEVPFAFQWIIAENRLQALKNGVNESLHAAFVSVIPGIDYYLEIYPNGPINDDRGQTWVVLQLRLGNAKKIEADYNVTIDSANYYQNFYHVYDKSNGRGNFTCSAEEFFDPNYKIFVNGKFTIKVDGIFKIDAPASVFSEQKWNGGRLGDELWLKDDTKDFVIVVENRYIKVHKFILINRSEVFAAMFKSNTKEFIENKVEIIDFPFDVVEAGILLMYDCNCITTLSFNYQMSLLQFFDKYNLPMHKAETEAFLISQVSSSTVCRLTNCSIFTNSLKLKEKCMEFLMGCFATKTPLCDINILDADIALEMLQNYRYHVAKTE